MNLKFSFSWVERSLRNETCDKWNQLFLWSSTTLKQKDANTLKPARVSKCVQEPRVWKSFAEFLQLLFFMSLQSSTLLSADVSFR